VRAPGKAVWLALLAAATLAAAPASRAQESIVKAEQLIRLQAIPLSVPQTFEQVYTAEHIDYIGWVTLRALGDSASWNPGTRGWGVYRANVRHSAELALRERWSKMGGVIRSMAQNPDTALAKHYADQMSLAELDQSIAFFGSDAGRKYVRYLRELSRITYVGRIELDHLLVDPELAGFGDSVAARRSVWLARRKISLDPPPAGYDFHLANARRSLPTMKPEDLLHALLAGAPPGSEAFERLGGMLNEAERGAVSQWQQSTAAESEGRARKAWGSARAASKSTVPLVLDSVGAMVDVLGRWRRVRANPMSPPRSIAKLEPGSIEIPAEYPLLPVGDPATPAAVQACVPKVGQDSLKRITQAVANTSVTVVPSNASTLYAAREGLGACIPLTLPGYPIPALNTFVGTLRIVGMEAAVEERWHRAIAQEVAAEGASESLIIASSGKAHEITFAADLQDPASLIYGMRTLEAGTYDASRYRSVHRVDVKGFVLTGRGGTGGAIRYRKSILTTPGDLRAADRQR
jgi:hypothetical protein